MYRITCDGLIILDTRLEDYAVFDPVVNVGTNTVGECKFKVYSSHPHFYDMNLLKSVFEVSDENGVIFRGRMTNNTRDFYNGKAVDLEGAMAFFNDSMVKPFVFPDDFSGASNSYNVVEFFLDQLIYWHNQQVEPFQQFKLGNVTVTDPNNYISRSSENIASTWQILKEKLFDSSLGGYLCIRYEEDGNYIDYLADFEDVNTQEIRFGKNLFDMKHEMDASTTYSAIIPIGADIEVEPETEDGETTTKKLTLESIADGRLSNTDDIYKVTLNNGLHALYSESAVENYGWICCPIEESTWDDVTDVNNLKNKARDYLLGTAGFCSDNIEVTAADLHFTDAEIESFRIYKKINVVSEPHNIEATYNLTRLSIDLVNPQNTKIVIGTIKDTLTDTVSKGGGSGSGGSHGSGGGGAIINASSIISALGYTPANEADIPDVPAWAKNPTKPTYTAAEVGARPNTWTPSASDVGADPEGTAEKKVSGHNTSTEAHNDIRILINELTTRLNALADSDDVTLDQMSELVAYIKDNRELIEGVTTNKVNVSDIIDNLTTNVSNKPLSAAQGVVLKGLIDAISEAFNNHASDKVAHITAAERTAWNNKAEGEHTHLWKDITDRAFGEFPADKGIDTVISNDIVHGKYVKVSDAIPTLAEVQQGGTVTYYNIADGEITGELVTANFPEGDYTITGTTNGIRINYDGVPLVLISFNGNPTFGAVTFPVVTEAGVYFDAGEYRCIHSLTINNYTGFDVIRTLPKKYLPKDIGTVKTVNGVEPNENGNIEIETVKTVNGVRPDKNGNIEFEVTGDGSAVNKYFTPTDKDILTWDGNTSGLFNIDNIVYKISDEAPTIEDASEGGLFKLVGVDGELVSNFTSEHVSEWTEDIYAIYGNPKGTIVVVNKDGASYDEYGYYGLEKGVYVSSENNEYIEEVIFDGYKFNNSVLKDAYAPKHSYTWEDIGENKLKTGGNTVTSNDTVYGRYRKVSDATPTLAEVQNGGTLSYYNTADGSISGELITTNYPEGDLTVMNVTKGVVIAYDGVPLVVVAFEDGVEILYNTYEKGTHFNQGALNFCVHSLTINSYAGFPTTETKKIPEKYLPEDYIKQLVKEVIAELVGTDTDSLKDINGDELYDMLSRKLIAKE